MAIDAEPFLVDVPASLGAELDQLYTRGFAAMERRRWDEAITAFASAYDLLIEHQPPGHRFHKGLPLHNMGLAGLSKNEKEASKQGANWVLSAFIEDALTFAEVQEPAPTTLPAAQVLLYLLAVPGPALIRLIERVRTRFAEGLRPIRPEPLAEELAPAELRPVEGAIHPSERRAPGQFDSSWDRRVFVGASYGAQIVEVNKIRQICADRGFDPVVELDFEIPDDLIHHHALMLLHECRWAVFEVSTSAGQLMELERCRDYQIEPLVVRMGTSDHPAHLSQMVASLLTRGGFEAQRYATVEELAALVAEYLDAAKREMSATSNN